jgi:predicted transport protein
LTGTGKYFIHKYNQFKGDYFMEINWLEILSKVFEVAIIPILSAAALYFVTYIKAKKQELASKIKNDMVKKYIDMLDKTIAECVAATNQTYVANLKKENMFDMEAQKKAFSLTYDAVLAVLTDEAQEYLNEAIKDVNAYITTKIEAQVISKK